MSDIDFVNAPNNKILMVLFLYSPSSSFRNFGNTFNAVLINAPLPTIPLDMRAIDIYTAASRPYDRVFFPTVLIASKILLLLVCYPLVCAGKPSFFDKSYIIPVLALSKF
jgi:hypothetical protein